MTAEQLEELLGKVISAYTELLATVEGECSSLLDPCSGGSDVLCNLVMDADEALTAYREARK